MKNVDAKQNKRKQNAAEKLEKRLHNKMIRVLSKAGLSWTTWIHLVEIADYINDEPVPTACWCYNEHTRKERIVFSRRLVKELPVQLLILILRHEMLHKSMYRGTKAVGNLELMNYALDCCINKILFMSDPRLAIKLGNWLFPPNEDETPAKCRTGVMAIMNPGITSVDRQHMNLNLQRIFDEIWWHEYPPRKGEGGLMYTHGATVGEHYLKYQNIPNQFIPEPQTLYNKLSSLLSTSEKEEIKEAYKHIRATIITQDEEGNDKKSPDHVRGGADGRRAYDKATLKFEKGLGKLILTKVRNNMRGGGYSNTTNMEAYFQEFVYAKKSTEEDGLREFIRQWETLKQVESAITTIYNQIKTNVSLDPYPMQLTRLGQELVALGISGPEMPLYFNASSEGSGGKKKVCCYFDTSPSMHEYIPFMLHVVDFFDDCEDCEIAGGKYEGRYCFSEKVKGIPPERWEEFKNGKIRGGCGTSFDALVTHALKRIDKDQVDIILIFTDGYSYVRPEVIEQFAQSGKKCYTLYFSSTNYPYGHERYRSNHTDEGGMCSDLDKLPGKSFTIHCPAAT